jgi:hypothetical protein
VAESKPMLAAPSKADIAISFFMIFRYSRKLRINTLWQANNAEDLNIRNGQSTDTK